MDLKQIKELMAAMDKAGLKKLILKEKTGFELHLEKPEDHPAVSQMHPVSYVPHPVPRPHEFPHMHGSHFLIEEEKGAVSKEKTERKEEGKLINAPMVGTFYASPSPEDPPFVKVGDRVEEHTVIGIIEAMKVMNELKAGVAGVVAEVCLESGHPVEFGTKLFRIV